jgi:hypothetical protein
MPAGGEVAAAPARSRAARSRRSRSARRTETITIAPPSGRYTCTFSEHVVLRGEQRAQAQRVGERRADPLHEHASGARREWTSAKNSRV